MASCSDVEKILHSMEEPFATNRAVLEAIRAVRILISRRKEVG
jgi:hypothetical protein